LKVRILFEEGIMPAANKLMRYSAFTEDPSGGNPAGVWIGNELPSRKEMLETAKRIGYSETAFIAPTKGPDRTVRYFSPEMEITFCGHATIASAVALGTIEGPGIYNFSTLAGNIPISVTEKDGQMQAALTSVAPRSEKAADQLVKEVLSTLAWPLDDLNPEIPSSKAYAGAWHLILAVKSLERLNRLQYDFEALKSLMKREKLTTIQLIYRETEALFHSRNPFPVGGVVEDPATGAAAAALGGYLREKGLVRTPMRLIIRQGEAMGRPSRLEVEIPTDGGIIVSGTAVEIPE
jgi:PhzF family phenazine biosynthesis protein